MKVPRFSLRTSDLAVAHWRGARLLSAITDLETKVKQERLGQPAATTDAGRIVRELVRKEAARIITHADVPEVRKKTETTGCLVAEFIGDIPLEDLEGRLPELIRTLSRLPKRHGTAHGKNRFKSDGPVKSKLEEIREADERDHRVFDALSAEPDLTKADRRARLVDRLVPRVTVNNLKCHLDGIDRILRAAEKDLGYSGTGDKVRRARSGTDLMAALADPTDRAATNCRRAGAGSVTLLPSLKKLIYPS